MQLCCIIHTVGWVICTAVTPTIHMSLSLNKRTNSSFYREAVENVAAYNLQLMKERKSRLPYVDAQTGIAQSDCHLLHSRLERRRGYLPGQVYSYPPRRWRKEMRPAEPRPKKGVCDACEVIKKLKVTARPFCHFVLCRGATIRACCPWIVPSCRAHPYGGGGCGDQEEFTHCRHEPQGA